VAYHAYYPFGEEATAFNQDTERMKFTGHERDLASPNGAGDDLDYMHARHESPVTGRFLSVDPKGRLTSLKDPLRWNRYSYVSNNPLRLIDPNGKEQITFTITTAIQAPMISAPILGFPPIRYYAGGLKTFQRFTVETDPSRSAKPVLPGSQKAIGETHRVDSSGTPTGERATASSDGLGLFSGRNSQGDPLVLATGVSANPLHEGAPPITYGLLIAPNQAGTSLSLTGTFGGYPTLTVTATNSSGQSMIYQFDENTTAFKQFSLLPGVGDQDLNQQCTFGSGCQSAPK
jgi:RHS repeat-associated protein